MGKYAMTDTERAIDRLYHASSVVGTTPHIIAKLLGLRIAEVEERIKEIKEK